ncbi:crotonase/enoyl-CoA hydratase family protein [Acinetobacter sp. MD2(2019)]|uniref:crotonase/enoyl-CoA hydratase family protein n=1 Tax=Acinetobacter sp. MD2(2019) TaxID=2605273 RepID=UPI002D1E90C3|nr:crotonase/enoyl-CoA hydratase family protein [Acinetobacter sp. MD2(2019)]MEB3754950.1 crotonase/enoyl-CoA hydratase family protein [Acinetobacter sp. MD2(2019)]
MSLLRIENNNHIVTIYLSRPEKRNAMNFALLQELYNAAKTLKKDRQLRAVILTGDAQIFSAGIDLADLNAPAKRAFALWELIKPSQSLFQKACLIWQDLPVPVICAIEGYCFGAGLQLALAADFRICHPTTQLSIMESRWGLVPDMGISQSLRGLVPIDTIKELTYTARIFNGEYAKSIGLVSHLSEHPLAQAQALADEIALRSPDAISASKQVLQSMLHLSTCKTLYLEKLWQLKLILGKNSRIARIKDKNPTEHFQPRQF